ncbi:MAG: hypothetical protein A2Y45_08800 [Tenericutes bacterium GWC2_34_14]|nr:MAG: hypothetical protein A2Z84_04670 [Tenericutes bacterium GWA2_35_7]OHE29991.1 MAG: hypothetical protein A2Y45_08800 [Tenericutes bacterium GWC2_34_14]OHE34970.1 MAG: hypothetical protein A2012_02410 [Tenericutes bacterium GWE2_34_108]OHE37170.1 MAG: hypothetical protein A2Y46_00600 [Tenericutes bacterium GWF1_35_14]OHE39698.1 MAG: hypothetical protein A2Y44_02260 [Tenericutes bacterium GWF2_35_184]OHE44114.1 MAG: hypothetical protein A2221_03250 [Tenericutes bacterium RIFOXYA2_FULL_36_3
MKNVFLGLTLVAGFITIGMLFINVVNAATNESNSDVSSISYNRSGMMNFDNQIYNDNVYERIYMHVSDEDQSKLDDTFADELKNSDIDTKTIEEVVVIVDQIKLSIIDDLSYTDTRYNYGMMGGSMMGYGSTGSYGCGYQNNFYTFEWYYVHTYGSDRDLVDYKYAELLKQINFDSSTTEEVVLAIKDIKTTMIDYIIEINQLNN